MSGPIFCPRCQSQDVRSLGVLHAEGKSSGGGATVMPTWINGHMGVMIGSNRTNHQTELSERCAPPDCDDFREQAEREVGPPPEGNGCGMILIGALYWPIAFGMCCLAAAHAAEGPGSKADGPLGFLLAAAVAYGIWWAWLKYWITPKRDAHNDGDYRVRVRQGELYATAMEEYHQSFLCLKCGQTLVTVPD